MIGGPDHLVLTIANENACARVCTEVMDIGLLASGGGREAFRFDNPKIDLPILRDSQRD